MNAELRGMREATPRWLGRRRRQWAAGLAAAHLEALLSLRDGGECGLAGSIESDLQAPQLVQQGVQRLAVTLPVFEQRLQALQQLHQVGAGLIGRARLSLDPLSLCSAHSRLPALPRHQAASTDAKGAKGCVVQRS